MCLGKGKQVHLRKARNGTVRVRTGKSLRSGLIGVRGKARGTTRREADCAERLRFLSRVCSVVDDKRRKT